MKNQTILIACALVGLVLFLRKDTGGADDLCRGWKLGADGRTATGPNGAQAVYTGYMTGDVYSGGGMLTL
jgi:hypothetical protein